MSHGTFSGEPETHWLMETGKPDRRMKLLARFSFEDPDGKEWITPVNYCVDGLDPSGGMDARGIAIHWRLSAGFGGT
jgi:hypothetical protein